MLERGAAERLRIRVAASAKPSNIFRILESCGLPEPGAGGIRIVRERCWAAGPGGEPMSYFELDLPS